MVEETAEEQKPVVIQPDDMLIRIKSMTGLLPGEVIEEKEVKEDGKMV